jgi:hypothetical protein
MVFSRLSTVLAIVLLTSGFSFADTVYHLKGSLTIKTNAVDIRDVIEEEMPAGVKFPLRTGRTYSNMELCGILNLMGLKDYVLAGTSIDLRQAAETVPAPEDSALPANGLEIPAPSDVFYLQLQDKPSGTGELIFRKGNITIVSRVKIVRGDREGYLVQNTVSGKKFKVPGNPIQGRSER